MFAEGARIEAPRGVGSGEGVSPHQWGNVVVVSNNLLVTLVSTTAKLSTEPGLGGIGLGSGAVLPPQKIF